MAVVTAHQAIGRAWLMVADTGGSPGRGSPASGARGSGPWPGSAPDQSPARHHPPGLPSVDRRPVPPSPRSNHRATPASAAIPALASPTPALAPRSPSWARPQARVTPAPLGRCWPLKKLALSIRSSGATTPPAKCMRGRSISAGPGQAPLAVSLIPTPAPALISWHSLGLPAFRSSRHSDAPASLSFGLRPRNGSIKLSAELFLARHRDAL